MNKIVFWEPSLSPHKIAFYRRIKALRPDLQLICCAHQEVHPERLTQGWEKVDAQDIVVHFAPDKEFIHNLISESGHSAHHVFSGWRWLYTLKVAFSHVKRNGYTFSIMAEPRVYEGFYGKLRYIHSIFTENWLKNNCHSIFAIGANGPTWFSRVGYSSTKIFCFGYFIDPPAVDYFKPRGSVNDFCRIGYLGRLTDMKGVDDIIKSMLFLEGNYTLDIAGVGDKRNYLENLAKKLNVNAVFHGAIPMKKIGDYLASLDVLVSPSRSTDDGWGVVVSEALMTGIPVVVTDCVGSSVVVAKNRIFGIVVEKNLPKKIAGAINCLIKNDFYGEHCSLERKKIARKLLSAENGARFFLDVLNNKNRTKSAFDVVSD